MTTFDKKPLGFIYATSYENAKSIANENKMPLWLTEEKCELIFDGYDQENEFIKKLKLKCDEVLGYDASSNIANCKWHRFKFMQGEGVANRCEYISSMEYYAVYRAARETLHDYVSGSWSESLLIERFTHFNKCYSYNYNVKVLDLKNLQNIGNDTIDAIKYNWS